MTRGGPDTAGVDPDEIVRREREELREQIARTVGRAAWGQEPADLDYVVADALLSGPLAAVLGRLADAEARVRRAEALHRPIPSEGVGPDGPYARDICDDCDEYWPCATSRALADEAAGR